MLLAFSLFLIFVPVQITLIRRHITEKLSPKTHKDFYSKKLSKIKYKNF